MTPPELYSAWQLSFAQQDLVTKSLEHWHANAHRMPKHSALGSTIAHCTQQICKGIEQYQQWLVAEHEMLVVSDLVRDSWAPTRDAKWHTDYIDNCGLPDPSALTLAIHVLRNHSRYENSCLYLGCGKGTWKRELASFNPIICADINSDFFDYVKSGYNPAYFNAERMLFRQVVDRKVPVDDQSIDFVFSWDTFPLLNLDELRDMLAETARVLVPGGRAMVHFADCFNRDDYAWVEQRMWAYMDRWLFIDQVRSHGLVPIKITKDQYQRSTCMLFQKPGTSNYDPIPENYEKLDTQTLDRLITILP